MAVGDVDREEIRRRNKTVHGFQAPDVVGVHVVGILPAERLDGGISLGAEQEGSEPMIVCSRLDLFQTGMNSAPSSVASWHARSCALP